MNKFIRAELEKCKYANIPSFDDDTTVLKIPRTQPGSAVTLRPGKYYLIEIADYVFNPSEGLTLSANWNGGSNPPCKYMNVEVVHIEGRMYKVNGTGFDPHTNQVLLTSWTGWLPGQAIKVIEEV